MTGRLVGWLADSMVFGLLACVAFGTWAAWLGWGRGAWIAFFVLLGLALAAYGAWALSRGTSLDAVAIRLDRELGLCDRISSALAFSRTSRPSGFMLAHLEETAAFLERQPDRAVAVPWPARVRALALFLVIALVSLLPHADRSRIEARARHHQRLDRVRAARDLARELHELRRQADLAGLHRLERAVADAEQALQEKIELVEPEDLLPPEDQPPPDSEQPVTSSGQAAPETDVKKGRGAVIGSSPAGRPRLSQTASYRPVGKFDSYPAQAYAEVFAELDGLVLGDAELDSRDLANLAKHLDRVANKFSTAGYTDDLKAFGLEGAMRGPQGEEMMATGEYNGIERGLASLQTRAFSEFLKRYSAHLGEKVLGQARLEKDRRESQDGDSGQVVNLDAPPPKDAKFAIRGVGDKPGGGPQLTGTPEQMAQLAAQTLADGRITGQGASHGLKVRGAGTSPGGQGAGVGAGGGSGLAAPKVLPRAAGGEYLPLEGKLSDGRSVIRLIDAQGRRTLGARAAGSQGELSYREVFVGYARGAEAELNGERVPLDMRDYVREYFRSIRPQAR